MRTFKEFTELTGLEDIKKTIKQKHGLEWTPNYMFKKYSDAVAFTQFIIDNTEWHYRLVPVDNSYPFGAQYVLISKDWITPRADEKNKYQAIRAWGKFMGSNSGYIDRQVKLAQKEGAPFNAIYREAGDEDKWATVDDVENLHALKFIANYALKRI